MKNKSLWLDEKREKTKKIDKDVETDVLVIGGGITGLSIMYQLVKKGINTTLVERNICGEGVTSRSTAKITFLQEKLYMNIRKFEGEKIAREYLNSQIEAVNTIKNIITDEKIPCDLEEVDSILFTNKKKNYKKLRDEYNFLLKSNVNAKLEKIGELSNSLGIRVKHTYVFNPVKYINGLKSILLKNIFENSRVTDIKKTNDVYITKVNNSLIKSKYVIIATHYPYFIFPFVLPIKSHIEKSYLGAVKSKDFKNFSAINIDDNCISMRYYKDKNTNYLIYLYGSYKSSNIKNIKYNFNKLKSKYNFDYTWSNKDIITDDYRPYIGKIHKNDSSFLISTGYNTWGMTNATIGSIVIRDIIMNKNNKYINLFDPNRCINLNKVINFPSNLYSSAKSFLNGIKINQKNVRYDKINGKSVAIYRDNSGKDHIVYNRCPHMKCGLLFNEVELTWDCMCHGSRFDLDGKCIESPSNFDIKYYK